MSSNKRYIGSLIVIILATAVYVTMGNVKIRVDDQKSTFYVIENGRWRVSGREYNKMFDGTRRLNRDLSETNVNTVISEDIVTITRNTRYKRGPLIVDTYIFNGTVEDVELFPISHTIELFNATGYIYQYEVRELVYDGPTERLYDVYTALFGRNMKIVWDSDPYYIKVFKTGILKLKWRITDDYKVINARLFDPLINADVLVNMTFNDADGVYSSTLSTDLAGNYNGDVDGALNGSPGFIAEAYHYDGTGSDVINLSGLTAMPNHFTISLWFKTEALSDFQYIFTQLQSVWSIRLSVAQSSGLVRYFVYNTSAGSCCRAEVIAPSGTIAVGNWYFFVATFNGTTGNTSLYINNVNMGSSILAGPFNNLTGEKTYLGRSALTNDPSSFPTNGTIDELLIFNRFVDAEDAQSLYESYVGPITDDIAVTLSLNNISNNVTVELGSIININISVNTSGTACLDLNHPNYGNNYFCEVVPVSQLENLNFTHFHTGTFNDSLVYQNLTYAAAGNQTVYVQSHQYDEILNMTINMSGVLNDGEYPKDVKIYINGSLSNSFTGELQSGTQTITDFNDSDTTKNFSFKGSGTDTVYVRLLASGTVTTATLDFTGINITNPSIGTEYYVIVQASSLTCAAFTLTDCEEVENGWFKISKNSSTYEVNRAIVAEELFSIGQGSNIITDVAGVTGLLTPESRDIDRRIQAVTAVANNANKDDPDATMTLTGNFTNVADNTVVSSWTKFEFIGGNGVADSAAGTWDVPVGTELVNFGGDVNGNGENDEFSTDTSGDEKSNPADCELYVLSNRGTAGVSANIKQGAAIIYTKGDILWDPVGTGPAYSTTLYDFFEDGSIPAFSDIYTNLVTLEVGTIDGTFEWTNAGQFKTKVSTTDLTSSVNEYLNTCVPDDDGYCNVPFTFSVNGSAKINVSDVDINYSATFTNTLVDRDLIVAYLGNSTNVTGIPLTVENSQKGTVNLSVDYRYYGGNKTYTLRGHDTNYNNNVTYNLTFFYSRWDYEYPPYVNFLEWIPGASTKNDVAPFAQLDNVPIFNVTGYNHGGLFNLSIEVNETYSCVNLSGNVSNNISQEITFGSKINLLKEDIPYLNNFGVWLWADFNCSFTQWNLWEPDIYLHSCCTDCDICDLR